MKKESRKITIFLFIIIFLCLSNINVESTDLHINERNAKRAIVELADAYYNRGTNVQYCSYRKSFTYSPEEATNQHTNYVVCSDYIYSVYYQAFGIRLPHLTNTIIAYAKEYYNSNNIEENDVIEYWEKTDIRHLYR